MHTLILIYLKRSQYCGAFQVEKEGVSQSSHTSYSLSNQCVEEEMLHKYNNGTFCSGFNDMGLQLWP
jgi:hypothetical protein